MSLERMQRMRESHKESDKREALKHPVTGEEMELGEHDRTLDQIFQNKDEQDLFINRYAYDKDPEMATDIAESLEGGTLLTSKQETFLEKVRGQYNLRRLEIEKVQEMFNADELKHIAHVDPRIQQIVGQIGPEKAAELMSDQFQELAMSDARGFERMVKALKGVRELRTSEQAAALDQKVDATLKYFGVSEEKYFEAAKSSMNLKSGITAETRDRLQQTAAEQLNLFWKSIDWVTGNAISSRQAREMGANFEEQRKFLQQCDEHMKKIGTVLQGTLNPEVSLAIQKYMVEGGSIKEKKPENNVRTVQDYRQVKNEFDPTAQQQRWEQHKVAELRKRNINNAGAQPQVQDQIKESFASREFQRQNQIQRGARTSGAFAALLALLFGGLFKTKDDLKNSLAF